MRTVLIACALLLAAGRLRADADADFFENKVRPVLAENCFKCHGEAKAMAGLRLDTAEGLKAGGDEGAVVKGADLDKSKLVRSVRRIGDAAMPPNKPLKPEEVAAIEQWVKSGTKYPAAHAVQVKADPLADHWAFQSVKPQVVPAGPSELSIIDRFLKAKLAQKKLDFAPRADRRTLLRRVAVDLTGLPPTADELDRFAADPDPKAYEKAVDRLLASPQYGERWGRHWLDIARYADSKGYVFQENRDYPYAYTYRDYVITSLNDDKPYDRFVTEQIAADRLDLKGDKKPLAALGFLTLGRRFSNDQHAIIDDRIDVVTRGFLGLTVQCARCHDHKFDPISAADYYALYGVFASITEPKELPVIGEIGESKELDEYKAELAKREQKLADYRATKFKAIQAELRTPAQITRYLVAAQELLAKPDREAAQEARLQLFRVPAFQSYRAFLKGVAAKSTPVWSVWLAASMPKADIAAVCAKPGEDVPKALREALAKAKPKTLPELATVYAGLVGTEPTLGLLAAPGGPLDAKEKDLDRLFDRAERDKRTELQRKIDGYKAASPFAPARAMVVVDLPQPMEPVVFVRGNPDNRGAKVARRAPGIIDRSGSEFKNGSGRLELAARITDPANPLTARVIVNRVWAQHFGRGLVTTPSDFGVRANTPSHPELLDYLAGEFVADGWSLKRLHKRLVTTRAYQQTAVNPAATAADPENVLLGRMLPVRMDFESMRDAMLLAAGRLDRTLLGRSVDLFANPAPTRRSVYASVDRQNLPGTLRTFDFASPDAHSPGRFSTTVPQQALFFLNSPFAVEQAKAVVARPEVRSAKTPQAKVTAISRVVLGRTPRPDELAVALKFVQEPTKKGDPSAWDLYAQALLMSNEFLFVD